MELNCRIISAGSNYDHCVGFHYRVVNAVDHHSHLFVGVIITDYSVVRDFWGRPYVSTDGGPLLFEPGRKGPVNAKAYTRISTLSGGLDDKGGLVDWTAAMAMIGVVKSKSIFAQIAHLASAHEHPWYSDGKKPLKELVQRAKDLGGADDAAGMGTAFHGLCEELDKGNPPAFVPEGMQEWIDARSAALADFEPVLIEPFVVNDELGVAGNPDRFLRHIPTGVVYAADDKTGMDEPAYPLKVTIQVAIASRSDLYDQKSGKRTPIDCDQSRGILIHTPLRSGVPQTSLYWLDLDKGWELAQLSAHVRDVKKIGKLERIK